MRLAWNGTWVLVITTSLSFSSRYESEMCDSVGEPCTYWTLYSCSKTRAAEVKPLSTSPTSTSIFAARFLAASSMPVESSSSWMTGAPSSMARSGSRTGGSNSYSTSMSAQAFSASTGVSAATAATRSPTKRTFVSSITVSNGDGSGQFCPAVENGTRGTSSCVRTQ